MYVEIPKIKDHNGFRHNLVKVEISDSCPVCGSKRGIRRWKGLSFDGSRFFEVDCWENECGHIDKYADVINEYCRITGFNNK
jgi:hypothetical protein